MTRLFELVSGEYFVYNNNQYQKVDNREKSGKSVDLKTGQVCTFPTMLNVLKIDKPKKTKKELNEPQPVHASVRLRNGRETARDDEHSTDSSSPSGLEEPGNIEGSDL